VSIETDFRALLAGYAPLTALVGSRIALNAVPAGMARPLVVFVTRHDLTHNLIGDVMADTCSVTVQCWDDSAATADAVADQVAAAVATAPPDAGAVIIDRASGYDAELDLHATLLTVEWWQE
jgi:Protein of unknown function (DUF3168)